MAKDNIESLLRIGSVAPDGTPINTPPAFSESQVVGGNVRLGETAKRVGPSGDEAMYAGLANIAGGLQTAINTFSDIAGREDKRKVTEVSMEMDRLDGTNLTPEKKQEALDAFMGNVWTPTLGTGWRKQIANDVNKRWLSDDARNAFEEDRYTREFATFLKKPEFRNRQATPELVELFQKEYESRFPTAETTSWYTLQRFETTSQLITKVVQDAKSRLAPAIENMIRIPNVDQQRSLSLGNQETMTEFKEFQDWATQARMAPDLATFTGTFHEFIQKEMNKTFDEKTPIEVKMELARDLPALTAAKARQIFDASSNMKYSESVTQATTSLITSQEHFKNSPETITPLSALLDAAMLHLPLTDQPLSVKRESLTSVYPFLMEKFQKAIDANSDGDLIKEFPGWRDMDISERLDVAETLFRRWANTPNKSGLMTNGEQLIETMGYTEDELKPFKSKADATEKLLIENGRLKALQSDSVKTERESDDRVTANSVVMLASTFDASDNPDWVDGQTEDGLSAIAKRMNISVETLKTAIYDKNGNPVSIINANNWLSTIDNDTEFRNLNRNGMTLNKNASLTQNLMVALGLVNKAMERKIGIQKSGGSKGSGNFKVDPIQNSANKFNPASVDAGDKKSIVNLFFKGDTGKQGEDSQFTSVVREYVASTLSESNQKFITEVDNELPFIKGYANAIIDGITKQRELLTQFVNNIPSTTGRTNGITPEQNFKEMNVEFDNHIQNLLMGRTTLDMETQPKTIIDPDGSWSKESMAYFVQVQFLARQGFKRESSKADREQFNPLFQSALFRLGTSDGQTYLKTPEGKFDLTVLALLGKEYSKASRENGSPPNISQESFFVNRAVLLGNWAEETNIDSMLVKLNSRESTAWMDSNFGLVTGIGSLVAKTQAASAVSEPDTPFYREDIMRNKEGMRVGSAFTMQAVVERVGNLPAIKRGVDASDARWKPGTLLETMNTELMSKNEITMPELAREIRILASSIPEPEWNKLSDENKVRAGAVALRAKFGPTDEILIAAMTIFFSEEGKNTPAFQPQQGETKLQVFMNYLDLAGDFNGTRIPKELGNVKVGSTVQQEQPMYIGFVSNAEGTPTPMFTPVITITSDELNRSFNIRMINSVYQEFTTSQINFEDPLVFKGNTGAIYYPRSITGVNATGSGTANGPMFLLGVTALTMPPSENGRRRLSLVQNWMTDHGFNVENVEEVTDRLDPRTESLLSLRAASDQQSLDYLAAKKALGDNVSKDFKSNEEFLEAVNNDYTRNGGSNPLFDQNRFNKRMLNGGGELLQLPNSGGDRMSELPTYGFSNVGVNGNPYITVTNDTFLTKNKTKTGELSGSMKKHLEQLKTSQDDIKLEERRKQIKALTGTNMGQHQ